MKGFENSKGLNVNKAIEEVSFPVVKEPVATELDHLRPSQEAVVRHTDEGREILGLVSKRRKIIPYQEIMGWLLQEFDNTGVSYKLTESSLVNRSDLFQQYIFEGGIDNPDGQDISPMILVKASHVDMPLKIDFGSFRYVCSNGAMAWYSLSSIKIKATDSENLLKYSLRERISAGLDGMKILSNRYRELENVSMMEYFSLFMQDSRIPTTLKKNMLRHMGDKGVVQIEDASKLKGKFLVNSVKDGMRYLTDEGDPMFFVNEDQSAWEMYNDATEVSTHCTQNELTRMNYYKAISYLFAA